MTGLLRGAGSRTYGHARRAASERRTRRCEPWHRGFLRICM